MFDDKHLLKFDSSAQETFQNFSISLHKAIASIESDDQVGFAGHLSKYEKLMPALALVFHLVSYFSGETNKTEIDIMSAERAKRFTLFLQAHAKKIYGQTSSLNSAVESLLRKIESQDIKDGMTASEICKRDWSGLKDARLVRDAIVVLAKYRYLFIKKKGPGKLGGKPTEIIIVNPIFSKGIHHGK